MSVRTIALPRREAGKGINWLSVWNNWVFVFVAVIVLLPLSFLILGSFSTASLPIDFSFAEMGWDNYAEVWLDPATFDLF